MPARLLTVVVFLVLVFGLNVAFRPLLKGTLGTSFRQQLKKQLFSVQVNKDDWRGISYSELKSDRSTFLDVVKKRAQTASPLRRSEESEVHKLLQVHSASLEASGLSRLTYNLGTLVTSGAGNSGAGSGRGSRDSASVLLGCVPRVAGQMGAGDVSSLLVGLARMGVKWRDIQRVGVLMDRVEVLIGKADETEIADIMWSLGTMGARWSEVRWKEALLNSLVLRIRKFSAYTLSSSLWSLAKVGVRWQDFDAAQKFQIMDQIAKVSTKVSPQNASKLLWALGSFGANFRHFPLGLLETLVLRVGDTKKSKMGNALSASHALSGTAKTGLQWTQASGATRAGLWEQVERVCQSSSDRSVSSAIWAVGTMGATADLQAPEMRDLMLGSAVRVMTECSAWELCNILWGLAKMKYRWSDFPRTFQDSVMMNTVRLQDDMNPVDAGTLLWSLGELDAALDAHPEYFREALLRITLSHLDDMKPHELSRTVWGYAGIGLSWNKLPVALQWKFNSVLRRVGASMSPQDVANCAYGLSILSFDIENPSDVAFRGVHETLLSIIKEAGRGALPLELDGDVDTELTLDSRVPYKQAQGTQSQGLNVQEREQLRIFAHYLQVMQFISDTKRIPPSLLRIPSSRGPSKSPQQLAQSSKLHERVVRGLEAAFDFADVTDEFSIQLEMSSFDGVFPVDAAVSRRGQIIALLEVDGPHHYRSDGSLRRKDLLKEAMYRRKHPGSTFHRIRWDEENKVGSDVLGEELAAVLIASCQKSDDVVGNTWRSLQKQMGDFFCWSLRNSK